MPEGPEVSLLCQAIRAAWAMPDGAARVQCHGKHLFLHDTQEDWAFGLHGTVHMSEDGALSKVGVGPLCGHIRPLDAPDLGIDWMTASEDALRRTIRAWSSPAHGGRRSLASLLLDQHRIAGIGVAWGSELAHRAGLDPRRPACQQSMDDLTNAAIQLREHIMECMYAPARVQMAASPEDARRAVNTWFHNLYAMRREFLCVYKVGTPAVIGGRTWWV